MKTKDEIKALRNKRLSCLQKCYEQHDLVLKLMPAFFLKQTEVITEQSRSWTEGMTLARQNMKKVNQLHQEIQQANHRAHDPSMVQQLTTFLWQGIARNKEIIPELMTQENEIKVALTRWNSADKAFQEADREYRCALIAHPIWGVREDKLKPKPSLTR